METKEKKSASFVCSRKEFYSALKTIKKQRSGQFTVATMFAEKRIYLKAEGFDSSVACSEFTGNDVSFRLPLTAMKQYCQLTPDVNYRFTLDGDSLQINTTIINV